LTTRTITALASAALAAVAPACAGPQYVTAADLLLFFDADHNPAELFENWDVSTNPTLPPAGVFFLIAGDTVEKVGEIGGWVKVRVRNLAERTFAGQQRNMLTALIAKRIPHSGQTGYIDRALFRSSFTLRAHELR
jgi:hypothetical protein